MDIITGEKFQYIANIYIGNTEYDKRSYVYNRTLKNNKCIPINKIEDNILLQESKIIFIYTHVFRKYKNKIIDELTKKTEAFILLFHNSDDIIDDTFTELLIKTKCKKIYGQNLTLIHKDFQYLPIGIANNKWNHGNLTLLNKLIDANITKKNKVFFNFTIHTNYTKRRHCYNIISKKNIKFTKNYDQNKYLTELKKHKFCISPDGNGPDCHRIWECLYLDVIPICKRSIFIDIIAKDFPIYIVDDWDKLEINYELYNSYDKMIKILNKSKLQFNYWKNMIET